MFKNAPKRWIIAAVLAIAVLIVSGLVFGVPMGLDGKPL